MARGLNLIELRNELDSEAQKRNLIQEKTIKDLNKRLNDMSKVLEIKDKAITQLQKRCMVLSSGTLCMFCGLRDDCKSKLTFEED